MDQGLKFNQIAAIDLERDVVEERPPPKDFESWETVSIAESAQCPLVRCPAQLVNHESTRIISRFAFVRGAQAAGLFATAASCRELLLAQKRGPSENNKLTRERHRSTDQSRHFHECFVVCPKLHPEFKGRGTDDRVR